MTKKSWQIPSPLPEVLWRPLVEAALREDLGSGGDITSESLIPAKQKSSANIVSRKSGRLAGLDLAACAFALLDPKCKFEAVAADGDDIKPRQILARIRGNTRAMLSAERTALNFLGRLSGIATATREAVKSAGGSGASVVCTRKTTPGLRALEKYAVRCGGGFNHRFNLDDAILIKDNHIAALGGVAKAVSLAHARCGHMIKVEVEVDRIEQIDEALLARADAILLDNFRPAQLKKAVKLIAGRAVTEASGGITLENIADVAQSGVDIISVGWITHSAPCLDLGLDM